MSNPTFERLLYTDCAAGGGRGGSNGFQIQAQSRGVETDQEDMAVGSLLYSTQAEWIAESRPVEAFPLGFAHSSDSGYGTAQSCYLGKEITGGRPGNHLADCLLTRDADLYGAIRPAQLWRSELWRSTPWDSIECPPFDGYLEPGPLDNEAVTDWLQQDPRRARPLAGLLTVLEQPSGPDVILVADEPQDALLWIAAATLLLPIRRAVEISFKVFVNNLSRGKHRIRAVPRSLNPYLAPGSQNSAFFLDAGTGAADTQAVSPRAAFWVERLLTADDPYDVVDAVELAAALGSGENAGESVEATTADARIVAWAITMADEPVDDPTAVMRWLSGARPEDRNEHGAVLLERILQSDPDAATVRWIDQAFASGAVGEDRARARQMLLRAEVDDARKGVNPPAQLLADLDAGPNARRDAESLVGSAILTQPSDAKVDALLRIARRHGIALPLASLSDRLHAFVTGWLDTPTAAYEPTEWALSEQILDLLHEQLTRGLDQSGPENLVPILQRVWPSMINRSGDLREPLNWHLHAAAVAATPPEQRTQRLSASFAELAQASDRNAVAIGMQQTMLQWGVIGPQEAMVVASLLPTRVYLHERIANEASAAVQQAAEDPDLLVLVTIDALEKRKILPSSRLLYDLWASDQRLNALVMAARSIVDEEQALRLQEPLMMMRSADPRVIYVWLPRLLRAALDSKLPWLGGVIMRYFEEDMALNFVGYWARELAGERSLRAAEYSVSWYEDTHLTDRTRIAIAEAIQAHLRGLSPVQRDQWTYPVQGHLGQDQLDTWISMTYPSPTSASGKPRRSGQDSQAGPRRGLFSREKK